MSRSLVDSLYMQYAGKLWLCMYKKMSSCSRMYPCLFHVCFQISMQRAYEEERGPWFLYRY